MTSRGLPAIAATLVLMLPGPALAHTKVVSTSPENGAVLEQSPAAIVINFGGPARLTSVVVLSAGKPDRKLEFTPSGSAASFRIPQPVLTSGPNEILWKALSMDGHVISGSLTFVIEPQ